MQAYYTVDTKQLLDMPLTMRFTATVAEWKALAEALEQAEKDREARGEHADPIRPVSTCIRNLMKALDHVTGHSYRARGYSYNYETCEATEV